MAAANNKFSFSVRSILDLPEQDPEAAPRPSPLYPSSSSPYTTWMECDRSPCMCECSPLKTCRSFVFTKMYEL